MAPRVSAIVTAIDETWSLVKTVDVLVEENRDDLVEIILAIAPRTTPECRASIAEVQEKYGDLIHVHEQSRLKFAGGANRECFEFVKGEYTVMMASDLETDPHLVKTMLKEIESRKVDVVATTRWKGGGSFTGYSKTKLILNWIFQKFFSALYWCNLSDMTYGFRMYRTEVLRSIRWEELRHAFYFETLVKPLRLGYSIIEIPAQWEPRQEGETNITTSAYVKYFTVGFKVRFSSRQRLKADSVQSEQETA